MDFFAKKTTVETLTCPILSFCFRSTGLQKFRTFRFFSFRLSAKSLAGVQAFVVHEEKDEQEEEEAEEEEEEEEEEEDEEEERHFIETCPGKEPEKFEPSPQISNVLNVRFLHDEKKILR